MKIMSCKTLNWSLSIERVRKKPQSENNERVKMWVQEKWGVTLKVVTVASYYQSCCRCYWSRRGERN